MSRISDVDIETVIEPAHRDYAKHHESLDGTSSVVASRSPLDWLERVHHLARSGEAAREEWMALELTSRELYWDRGRALSRRGHYAAAAEVYRRCLADFGPDDGYAQHYLGFNEDRAGGSFTEAQKAFEAAIAEESRKRIARISSLLRVTIITHSAKSSAVGTG